MFLCGGNKLKTRTKTQSFNLAQWRRKRSPCLCPCCYKVEVCASGAKCFDYNWMNCLENGAAVCGWHWPGFYRFVFENTALSDLITGCVEILKTSSLVWKHYFVLFQKRQRERFTSRKRLEFLQQIRLKPGYIFIIEKKFGKVVNLRVCNTGL